MNKYKLAGLIIALFLLIIAIVAMQFESTGKFFPIIITVGLWALSVVELLAYKTSKGREMLGGAELIRVISLFVVAVLLTLASVIYILF